jgi:hypothetical protein
MIKIMKHPSVLSALIISIAILLASVSALMFFRYDYNEFGNGMGLVIHDRLENTFTRCTLYDLSGNTVCYLFPKAKDFREKAIDQATERLARKIIDDRKRKQEMLETYK